jgi:translocation and assembly module TamB
MRLEAAFGPGELRVDALRARSGSGTAELQGVVGLSGLAPTTLDLSARLDRFLVSNAPPVTAVVSGDVVLRGTLEEPWLEGRLNPEGTTINLDDVSTEGSAQEVQLTAADYEMLEDYFGYSGDAESDVTLTQRLAPFGLRLSVSFDQDVFVTRFPQPRVSLECSGDLELDKEPGGPLRVVGTVTVLPERSYVRQFGRRFAIEEGTLTLDGEPADYAVDAQAQWELPSHSDPDQPEVVVNLDVSATAERTDLTLSSDPPMDESEIVSYLATGQAQGILASGDQASAANIGVATATGAVAGALESFAADRIALDVVEIAVDPVRGTTLVAGRYVSPDVYLGFRQPVSFGDDGDRNRTDAQLTEVELEYRWFRWLTLNLQTSASELRFYLRSRHDY